MLALGIHYLNGWAMAAADGANKEIAEWPPHPDRVFMALAAAWFETGEDPAEGEALRWIETLLPPAIAASDATLRTASHSNRPPVSYVPVNDTRRHKLPASTDLSKLKDAGLDLLPEHRGRQARQFPVAIPHRPLVHLIWSDADPGPHAGAIEGLVRKVTHVGHSASLTQLWLDPSPPEPTWLPDEGLAAHRLRIPSSGRLEYLREQCNREAVIEHADLQARMKSAKGKEKKTLKARIEERFGNTTPVSLRPQPHSWQGYARPAPTQETVLHGTLFDPRLLVLTLSGQGLSLPATLRLTNALRCTLLKEIAEQQGTSATADCRGGDANDIRSLIGRFPYPEWLCGHAPDGAPTTRPHIAWIPLPFVDAEHADGHIMGAAMILPRDLDPGQVGTLLEPWLRSSDTGLPRKIKLFDGGWLQATAELDAREYPPYNLRPETWTTQTTGACQWASVTPVVLDRHFKGADKWEQAAESIKDACERIGLPRPEHVELHPVSWVRGAPRATEFPYLTRKRDGGRIHHAHALLRFGEPVQGPILIGAGRFRGYGLCRPLGRCGLPQRGGSHE
ncbi:type I-G CRISPR-associated protein Csb2 [Candidatus Thiosymbion oneisti]|uniref:type I-G CRISPR-associated protein Csb2 n=1 Tax=Candidatus Thiosymbion oneisti TaxID=589554 RepID=UPI000A6E381D|nr:type I-U CRISPR-associated protein Csb2 [Candidatus Thiosymbion oneisti]